VDTNLDGLEFGPNPWHVHELAVAAGATDCDATGGHYNPDSSPQMGELSAHLGDLTNPSTNRQDIAEHISLYGADNIVDRSIVLHKTGSERWACASILLGPDSGRRLRRRQAQQTTYERRTPIPTAGMNEAQVEKQLLRCPGVVEETVVTTQRFNAGSGELNGVLTGVLSILSRTWEDIRNGGGPIIFCGPFLAALVSFLFILFMSRFAALIIWTVILCCELALLVLATVSAYQAGFLSTLMVELQNQSANSSHAAAAVAATQAIDQTQAQVGEFLSAHGNGEDDTGGEEAPVEPLFWWELMCYVTGVLAALYPCIVLALRKQIKLAIQLVKEAGRTLSRMRLLMFYPFFTYMWVAIFTAYLIAGGLYIFSSTLNEDNYQELVSASADGADDIFSGENVLGVGATLFETGSNQSLAMESPRVSVTEAKENPVLQALFLYHFFGYLWTVEFIKGIGILTIAGSISTDYWVDKRSADVPWFPLFPSFYRAVRYHWGSAIFGGLVLALIRLIRYIMMYVDSKTAELQKDNRWAKIIMAVVHCCLWCLEKCARFLTYSAYIMISIEGRGFCLSAWRSFKLIFSNSLRVAATQTLATIIILLAQLGVTASCTLLCYVVLTADVGPLTAYGPEGDSYVDSAVVPCILVFLSSFFVTSCFMGVYDTAIQTLLLSFCLDEDKFKRGLYKDKRDNTGQMDPRMFCVVNEKVGLIKLVSGSVKKQVKDAAREREELAALDGGDGPREQEHAP
jgi:hypothetical protein